MALENEIAVAGGNHKAPDVRQRQRDLDRIHHQPDIGGILARLAVCGQLDQIDAVLGQPPFAVLEARPVRGGKIGALTGRAGGDRRGDDTQGAAARWRPVRRGLLDRPRAASEADRRPREAGSTRNDGQMQGDVMD